MAGPTDFFNDLYQVARNLVKGKIMAKHPYCQLPLSLQWIRHDAYASAQSKPPACDRVSKSHCPHFLGSPHNEDRAFYPFRGSTGQD
jgi:hypothetical protein